MYSMSIAHWAGDPDELAPTRQSLLERLRDLDDAAAWQEFFDTYWKLIYASAIRFGLSDDEAEEVVQETVIGVARKMDTFRYQPQTCSFKGWLMHVTRRRIVDRLRKRHSQRGPHIPLPADTDTTAVDGPLQVRDAAAEQAFEGLWDEEWQKNLIDAAMERVKRKVPAKQYQIFYLHSVKNMAGRDISKLLGVSTAKVYVVRHRLGRLVKREVQILAARETVGPSHPSEPPERITSRALFHRKFND
jgi:RNA polymerase sigma-70 factor (ECF subfamily)